ncbi:MAG: potassium-transporting ATPase subunit F [Actinobacteria bacterium]|nr:potassium-transporting ATPase subunit F [Actinomycetota bacterium]
MSGDDIVGLIIAAVLLGFLIFALVAPERLS